MAYKIIPLLSALLLFSGNVYGDHCTQNLNELIGLVGLDSQGGSIYAKTVSEKNECGCTSVRFRPGNTDVEKALTILLSAKMAEKKVRIDLLNKDDCNSAYRVYIH